jgi:hypothetical protein
MNDKEKELNENFEEELELDDLENVTGGSLKGSHKRSTGSASGSSKGRA